MFRCVIGRFGFVRLLIPESAAENCGKERERNASGHVGQIHLRRRWCHVGPMPQNVKNSGESTFALVERSAASYGGPQRSASSVSYGSSLEKGERVPLCRAKNLQQRGGLQACAMN